MKKAMVFILLFFGGCEGKLPPLPPIDFPEKDLEWLIITGWYKTEDPERVERALERALKSAPVRGGLKEGQTIEEKRLELSEEGDEKFKYSQILYCYNENEIDTWEETEASFPYLKARLYDKDENILEEDFLRFDPKYADRDHRHYSVYIPYHKEGHRLKIIKELKGKEEDVFLDILVDSKTYLIQNNIRVRGDTSGIGFQYKEGIKCHTGR